MTSSQTTTSIVAELALIIISLVAFCVASKKIFLSIAVAIWGIYLGYNFYTNNNYAKTIGWKEPINGWEWETNYYHYGCVGLFSVGYPLILYNCRFPVLDSLQYLDFWILLVVLYPLYGWFQMYLFQSLATMRLLESGISGYGWKMLWVVGNGGLFSLIHLGDRVLMIWTFAMGVYYTIYVLDTHSIILLGPLHSYFATGYYYWIKDQRVLAELLD